MFALQFLPLMRFGLKAMSVVNGVSSIARVFGFPSPKVPEEWRSRATEVVGRLDRTGSEDEYNRVQANLGKASSANGAAREERQRGAKLREFEAFLDKNGDH